MHHNNVPHSWYANSNLVHQSHYTLLYCNFFLESSPGQVGQLSCVLRAYSYQWRPSVMLCTLVGRVVPLFPHYPPSYYPPLNSSLLPHVSHSTSSNLQLIFDNALKAYKKRTKNDLLTHPLADRFETCHSASSILSVLQEQVQELNQSRRNSTKWLDPTVNVIHAFSETLGEGVGSVCSRT